MPTIKPGQKQYQVVLDAGSEVHTTLLEWARKRGLTPGKATRCILADWSDAMNGKPNPFALAMASAVAGIHPYSLPPATPTTHESALSAEERARQVALLEAAEQFL